MKLYLGNARNKNKTKLCSNIVWVVFEKILRRRCLRCSSWWLNWWIIFLLVVWLFSERVVCICVWDLLHSTRNENKKLFRNQKPCFAFCLILKTLYDPDFKCISRKRFATASKCLRFYTNAQCLCGGYIWVSVGDAFIVYVTRAARVCAIQFIILLHANVLQRFRYVVRALAKSIQCTPYMENWNNFTIQLKLVFFGM